MKRLGIFLYLIASVTAIAVHAEGAFLPFADEPIFGFELTFAPDSTKHSHQSGPPMLNSQIMFEIAVRRAGVPGSSERFRWFFETAATGTLVFKTDPGVVEVNGTPQSAEHYARNAFVYDRLIFGAAREMDFAPHEILGGGHIHIGRVFDHDPRLLRDFYVDMNNHPSLFAGIFGYNRTQGLILADMTIESVQEYLDVIAFIDARPGMRTDTVVEELIGLQQSRRYAINLTGYFNRYRTLEVRIAPQKSFADFVLIVQFFRARLAYLKAHPNQEALVAPGPRTFLEARAEFRKMVVLTGLEWMDYAHFGIASGWESPSHQFRRSLFENMDRRQLKKQLQKLRLHPRSREERRQSVAQHMLSSNGEGQYVSAAPPVPQETTIRHSIPHEPIWVPPSLGTRNDVTGYSPQARRAIMDRLMSGCEDALSR